jgi:hypothetical protein
VDHVLIVGNRIKLAAQYGISADTDCAVWNISGNTFITCLGGGIYLNGDYNLVTSNQIDEAGEGVSITLGADSTGNYVGGNAIANGGGGITDGGGEDLNTFGWNHTAALELLRYRTTLPTDADLENQDLTIWVQEAGNFLKFHVKYSNGTVKSGTVALL